MNQRDQDEPQGAALLDAVARFLLAEVHPLLGGDDRHKGVAFRVLIAANLATIVAAELRGGEARDRGELQRLAALLPDEAAALGVSTGEPAGATRAADRAALAGLNQALAQALRAGTLGPERLPQVMAHLRQTLREDLAIANPRFSLDDDLEAND